VRQVLRAGNCSSGLEFIELVVEGSSQVSPHRCPLYPMKARMALTSWSRCQDTKNS
jgi:hypothetical protein